MTHFFFALWLRFKSLGGHVVSTAIIFLGAACIGALASLFANEILLSFPFVPSSGWSWQAATFWLITLPVIALSIAQTSYQHDKQLKTDSVLEQSSSTLEKVGKDLATVDKNLSSGVERLRDLIETMPPKHFLSHFQRCYLITNRAYEAVSIDAQQEVIEDHNVAAAIQQILDNILTMAQYWDTHSTEPHATITYTANVMMYRDRSYYEQSQHIAVLQDNIRFVDRDCLTSPIYDGYLVSTAPLTASLSKYTPTNTSNKSFILGAQLPQNDPNTSPLRIIHGAPRAFYDQKPQWIGHTDTIAIQAKNDTFLTPFLDEIKEYYTNETQTRSILSIPLTLTISDPAYTDYVGVLNIYRNEPHIVTDVRRSQYFSQLLTPFSKKLTDLLRLYANSIDQASIATSTTTR